MHAHTHAQLHVYDLIWPMQSEEANFLSEVLKKNEKKKVK